jgi:hypothetical protein
VTLTIELQYRKWLIIHGWSRLSLSMYCSSTTIAVIYLSLFIAFTFSVMTLIRLDELNNKTYE